MNALHHDLAQTLFGNETRCISVVQVPRRNFCHIYTVLSFDWPHQLQENNDQILAYSQLHKAELSQYLTYKSEASK